MDSLNTWLGYHYNYYTDPFICMIQGSDHTNSYLSIPGNSMVPKEGSAGQVDATMWPLFRVSYIWTGKQGRYMQRHDQFAAISPRLWRVQHRVGRIVSLVWLPIHAPPDVWP